MVKSLLEILTKKISQTFYKPIVAQLVTNVLGVSISIISMWNTVNQLEGNHGL